MGPLLILRCVVSALVLAIAQQAFAGPDEPAEHELLFMIPHPEASPPIRAQFLTGYGLGGSNVFVGDLSIEVAYWFADALALGLRAETIGGDPIGWSPAVGGSFGQLLALSRLPLGEASSLQFGAAVGAGILHDGRAAPAFAAFVDVQLRVGKLLVSVGPRVGYYGPHFTAVLFELKFGFGGQFTPGVVGGSWSGE